MKQIVTSNGTFVQMTDTAFEVVLDILNDVVVRSFDAEGVPLGVSDILAEWRHDVYENTMVIQTEDGATAWLVR